MTEFEEIYEEAAKRWYKHIHSGARGQLVTARDGLEYWVYEVTKEKFCENMNPLGT